MTTTTTSSNLIPRTGEVSIVTVLASSRFTTDILLGWLEFVSLGLRCPQNDNISATHATVMQSRQLQAELRRIRADMVHIHSEYGKSSEITSNRPQTLS